MSETIPFQPTVVRTSRGLTIGGTRLTLYQIMDYVKARQPPEIIREHFRLTIKQLADVLEYLQTHREEVERDYQRIVKQAEESRAYWQQRNQPRFAEMAARPRKPEDEHIWQKLEAKKRQREQA